MTRRHLTSYATLALFLAVLLVASKAVFGPTAPAPPEFSDTLVADVPSPTALAFTPDGRMLLTSQSGQLWVYQGGTLLATPALDLAAADLICSGFERGLLGVALDPAFAANRSIYLFYTFKKHGGCESTAATSPVNRVSRFVLADSNLIDLASEVVLLDNIPSFRLHNAGDIQFGRDGYLYISVGDGGCDEGGDSGCANANDAARRQHVLLGKILRITRDGGIPPNNPFVGANTARCNLTGRTAPGKQCQETFAWGLRNPFRIAFDPNAATTRFFINDVGQWTWEEINEGQPGADYGWNLREGHCAQGSMTACGPPPASITNPIFSCERWNCSAITGGAFVPQGLWSAEYDGAYLFGDYGRRTIFRLVPDGRGNTATVFARIPGGVVHMAFGPHGGTQALYYTAYFDHGHGQVRRISSLEL